MASEYEELVDKALAGDAEAAVELKEKYSGSNLRDQAETSSKKLQEWAPLVKQQRLQEAVAALPEELRSYSVSLEDLGEVPPEGITTELVKSKAEAKQTAVLKLRQQAATDAGFETVEEYEQALSAIRKQKEATVKATELVGAAIGSSGGVVPPEAPKEPHEQMFDAHEAARKSGKTQDYAMGEGIEALFTAQAPVEGEG